LSGLVKATISNLDSGGSPIECMFNPRECTFSKVNQWTREKSSGANVADLEFSTGQPATLSMELFFDTFAAGEDVRKEYTDALWELMLVDDGLEDTKNKKSRPPYVHFQWGKSWSFDAVITNIQQSFTLFLPDGTPVRATMKVTFEQLKDEKLLPSQNPTSGGDGIERVWTVQEGDTLARIAHIHYGDSDRWRRIANANHLISVRDLRPGTVLLIPHG